MTYEELIAWGNKNYLRGGDVFVECWSEEDFDTHQRVYGPMTEERAATLARMYESIGYGQYENPK